MPALALAKSAIDLGLVTQNAEAMLAFYRDILGLPFEATLTMPGGTVMHRLTCGQTTLKLLQHQKTPNSAAAPGGITGATGIRYFTISVTNLAEMLTHCAAAGVPIPVGQTEIRPGVQIAMLEDPEGNWVELLETTH